MAWNQPIQAALGLPSGARYYRCALQVNPYEYLKTQGKATPFADEAGYNAAIIQTCKEQEIEVIAVTDHYRHASSIGLGKAARQAGIHVFPGFEAVTSEGVHLLCLFDPETPAEVLERRIGACGIGDQQEQSPIGDKPLIQQLAMCRGEWNAVSIAAHVAGKGGLLRQLSGQARVRAWKSGDLLACSLPGPVGAAPDDLRPILENRDSEYKRDHPVAILNAKDVSSPADLRDPGASCWIKMSEVSIEGLRQAFLDPDSRIRLASDPRPEERSEFLAMAWEGGFLDGQGIHFNRDLNVLIGGRGTGKSTIVESLRYALQLEPIGDDARKTHEGIVRSVLKSGTRVSLLVRSHRPNSREFLIERTVPNPPVVKDNSGGVVALTPQDVLPGTEIYGQHEISELAKSPEKLPRLLERFMDTDHLLLKRKAELQRRLERSRSSLIDVERELLQIEERLAALPSLEETLKRYQEAGLEDQLKQQSLLVQEERILATARERVASFRELVDGLAGNLPIDRAFVSEKALQDLPGQELLRPIDGVLETLNQAADGAVQVLIRACEAAQASLDQVRIAWGEQERIVKEAYQQILRDLQKSRVDGEEFIRLRRQIEDLRPLQEREGRLRREETELQKERRSLLVEWEDVKREEFQRLSKAAKAVSRKLRGRLEVEVVFAGDREPLLALLSERGGRWAEIKEALRRPSELSLQALAQAIRVGASQLASMFPLSPAQAERLAQTGPDVIMKIEELDLPPTITIKLNVATEQQPQWRMLDQLSTGQKATAVLLLLLLESTAPLVVDQPEDDLDNRFVADSVVPEIREGKRHRQHLFATHNANIPVLGDAEIILGLTTAAAPDGGQGELLAEHMGSIDAAPVREFAEEVLEGGKDAFETRRRKYGF